MTNPKINDADDFDPPPVFSWRSAWVAASMLAAICSILLLGSVMR
jgi:hypothetical protein